MVIEENIQFNPLLSSSTGVKTRLKSFVSSKHPKSICIVNYKGGVGKTTIACLLGYYLSQRAEIIKRGREKLKERFSFWTSILSVACLYQ